MLHKQLLHVIILCIILYWNVRVCVSLTVLKGNLCILNQKLIAITEKVHVMIRAFMYQCGCVHVYVYYIPVEVLAGCFVYCSIFIVYNDYVFIRDVCFGMAVLRFNLVFHKVGKHDFICSVSISKIVNLYFGLII